MPYAWDSTKRRYVRDDGSVVTPKQQREIALRVTTKASEVLENITRQMTEGQINSSEWAIRMRENIKMTHSALAQIAHGGKDRMGPQQLGRLGASIRRQNEYLDEFVATVQLGEGGLTEGAIINRARMYGDAGWTTYEAAIAQRERHAGMGEERSILDAASQHCEDCPSEADKGWSPIGSLIPIGERQCLSRCRCSFEYR